MMLHTLIVLGFLSLLTVSRPNCNGYRVFQVDTSHGAVSDFLDNELSGFDYEVYDSDSRGNLSVAIAPDNITAFEALGLQGFILHDDLGADINAESTTGKLAYERTHLQFHFDAINFSTFPQALDAF